MTQKGNKREARGSDSQGNDCQGNGEAHRKGTIGREKAQNGIEGDAECLPRNMGNTRKNPNRDLVLNFRSLNNRWFSVYRRAARAHSAQMGEQVVYPKAEAEGWHVWSSWFDGGNVDELFLAVLEIPPVESPITAVRASIMAQPKGK